MDIASIAHEERGKDRADRLFEVADRQAGYFTARQARVAGYNYRLQHYHRERGNWIPVGHGLYRLRQYPDVEDEELVHLSLWSRNRSGRSQAVVSHETALRLHELTDLMSDRVHLSVPKGFRKEPPKGVVLHKAQFDEGEVEARRGYRVTTPLRTILDVARGPRVSPEPTPGGSRRGGPGTRSRAPQAAPGRTGDARGRGAEIHRGGRDVRGGAVMVNAGRVAERKH